MNKDSNISVVINTLNEEKNIEGCIESVLGIADEIIVCDMYSDDKTVEIARSLGATVVFHPRLEFVEPARYYAISQAGNKWVLVIDADERATKDLADKLLLIARENLVEIVVFGILYYYFGNYVFHGGFFEPDHARFFRKNTYLETHTEKETKIHRNFKTIGALKRNSLQLPSQYYLLHLAYPTIEKYISKTLGKYARIEAEQYFTAGKKFSIWRLILLPVKIFLQRFLLRQGYRDGVRGFILSVLYSGYWFAIQANLWFLEQQQKEKQVKGFANDDV